MLTSDINRTDLNTMPYSDCNLPRVLDPDMLGYKNPHCFLATRAGSAPHCGSHVLLVSSLACGAGGGHGTNCNYPRVQGPDTF